MNIVLIGYGKMGQAIEAVATSRGHQIVARITRSNEDDLKEGKLHDADLAIEFTGPDSALKNVKACMEHGLPVVCGSTGWNKQLPQAKEKCLATNTAFLQTSNFSIGVNIFFEINKQLAAMMNDWPEYDVSIKEVHHTAKKDAPSGTAITLAEQITDNLKRKSHWHKEASSDPALIPVYAERTDEVPGTHFVRYTSDIDDIELIHTAHSRKGFALGAVLAAEYIQHRKGIFTMRDVLLGGSDL